MSLKQLVLEDQGGPLLAPRASTTFATAIISVNAITTATATNTEKKPLRSSKLFYSRFSIYDGKIYFPTLLAPSN